MTAPFIGQLIITPFGFVPKGYALCNGQQLPIAQNQGLFSLIGTTYGGNGINTFALPNLQGAVVLGSGGKALGAIGGEANHTLTPAEIPPHTHPLMADAVTPTSDNESGPSENVLGQSAGVDQAGNTFPLNLYSTGGPSGSRLADAAIGPSGGQPHPNLMPSLVVNYCIALTGIFPSRT